MKNILPTNRFGILTLICLLFHSVLSLGQVHAQVPVPSPEEKAKQLLDIDRSHLQREQDAFLKSNHRSVFQAPSDIPSVYGMDFEAEFDASYDEALKKYSDQPAHLCFKSTGFTTTPNDRGVTMAMPPSRNCKFALYFSYNDLCSLGAHNPAHYLPPIYDPQTKVLNFSNRDNTTTSGISSQNPTFIDVPVKFDRVDQDSSGGLPTVIFDYAIDAVATGR